MSDICHYELNVYMPNAYNTSDSVVQSLISKIKKAITVILEDELSKQRLNALGEECQCQDGAVNIVSFFHSDMDKYNDLYRINLNVGMLETYIEKSELNGRRIDVYNYPYDQAVWLADRIVHSLWELLNKSYNVLVQVNYSTQESLCPPIVGYQTVEAFLKKEQNKHDKNQT
mgnify:CR=1 FL=1